MSGPVQQFPFVARDPALGSASLAPMMPLTLKGTQSLAVSALLDTRAAVNVLPFGAGAQLGFVWDQETASVQLSGNLASVEARVVLVSATVAEARRLAAQAPSSLECLAGAVLRWTQWAWCLNHE